jgi:hypothetical protein
VHQRRVDVVVGPSKPFTPYAQSLMLDARKLPRETISEDFSVGHTTENLATPRSSTANSSLGPSNRVCRANRSTHWFELSIPLLPDPLIENFFARIEQLRAVAIRYDKTARNFVATAYLIASVVWLN